jgi:nitrate reductase molybdenum cofactor assembly chaperone NarJ/NarW
MKFLTVLSLLMDYPENNSPELMGEVQQAIEQAAQDLQLPEKTQQGLQQLITHFSSHSLRDLQSDYDGLFERGRALSLHLFEHIHGESRDRGQAMVNLQQQYRDAGLDIGVKNCPIIYPYTWNFYPPKVKKMHV